MTAPPPLHVAVERHGRVLAVTLDRPPVNAIGRQMLEELRAAFAEAERDAGLRAVVLAGKGGNFASGADIKEFAALPDAAAFEAASALAGEAFAAIESMPVPVIAAVDGWCLGGGNELAMACHMRVAGAGARFGQPEIRIGLIPGFGGTQRLPRLVGRGAALRIMLGGEHIDAAEALRIGLVDDIAPEGRTAFEHAMELAQKIAGFGAGSVARILNLARMEDFERGIAMEREAFGRCGESPDGREGVAAFLAKRAPKFEDAP